MGMLRAAGALFAWFCIATTLAIVTGLGWLQSHGLLTEDKLVAALKAMQASDAHGDSPGDAAKPEDGSEPSLEEILAVRALKTRDIELREQNLANGEALLQTNGAMLNDNAVKNERTIRTFETELAKLQAEARDAGGGHARAILEKMKPDQAKLQLMTMYEEGELTRVIGLLTAMPEDRRKKIVDEFTDSKDIEALAAILKELDRGAPLAPLIQQKQKELQQSLGQSPTRPAPATDVAP